MKFHLEMLTPERKFFTGDAESITVTAPDGEVEILAGHMPVVIGLKPGQMRIFDGENKKLLANGEGFLSVDGNNVFVMCQTFEWPEEISLERVNRALEEHRDLIKTAPDKVSYRISKMAIARALARLKVAMTFKNENK